jgi:DNA polymerase-3 subunit delta
VPLYILHGTETVARKEAFEKLRAGLDTDGSLATNTVTFEATQSTPAEVIAACDTVPFLGDHRLVVVERLLTTAGRKRQTRKKDPPEEEPPNPWLALAEYVDRLPETTTLVLVDDEAPPSDLTKKLLAKGNVQKFATPGDKELPGWVAQRAKEMGVKIEPAAAKLLAELVGSSSEGRNRKTHSHTGLLINELDKLAAYANGEVIRQKDVQELVGRAKEHKGWDLTDAIIDGKGATAARVLQEMIDDGGVLQVMLATVASSYRRIAVAKDLLESGASGEAVRQHFGMKPGYGVEKLVRRAEQHSWDDLRSAYQRLIEADLDVKQLNMDEQLALELAVQDLAMRSARRTVRTR